MRTCVALLSVALLAAAGAVARADEPTTAPANPPASGDAAAAPAAPAPAVAAGHPACDGGCRERGWRHLLGWFTYRPVEGNGCCLHTEHCGCCRPPLYAFFMCYGCGAHAAYGPAACDTCHAGDTGNHGTFFSHLMFWR